MLNLPTGQQAPLTVKPEKPPTRYMKSTDDYVPGPYLLSPREFQVLNLLCKGQDNKAICIQLNITDKTVKLHKTGIFRKYNVKGIGQLLAAVIAEKNEQIKVLKGNK